MKLNYFAIMLIVVIISCTDDTNTIETVLEDVERGAVLRTLDIPDGEFYVNMPSSKHSVHLELQDIAQGRLMKTVDVYVSFIDRTEANGVSSPTVPERIAVLRQEDFEIGSQNLPIISLSYTFQELIDVTETAMNSIACGDQFKIMMDLNLTDGRTFSTLNSAGTVVNNTGFFKSPFNYVINIVEPVTPEKFIGQYSVMQIEDGFYGDSFPFSNFPVTIRQGRSTNMRVINFGTPELGTFDIEFNVTCIAPVITQYQKSTLQVCTHSGDPTDRVLLGPDYPSGLISIDDDSVFEMYVLEGFEGYNTQCEFSDYPAKIRFSKQ